MNDKIMKKMVIYFHRKLGSLSCNGFIFKKIYIYKHSFMHSFKKKWKFKGMLMCSNIDVDDALHKQYETSNSVSNQLFV